MSIIIGDIFIDLKETGEGAWRVSDNEDSFTWYVKSDDELRLNTKLGGVIGGKIQDGTIVIILAGREKITFKKSKKKPDFIQVATGLAGQPRPVPV